MNPVIASSHPVHPVDHAPRQQSSRMRAALQNWRNQARQRRAIRELRGLDDRMLKDMGLHRGIIRDVVINGRPQTQSAVPVNESDPVDAWARHAAVSNGFGG